MILHRILPDKKLIVICNWGGASLEEARELRRTLRATLDLSETYDVVIDNTFLENQYTTEEMTRLSREKEREGFPSARVAVVAPTDLSYGMSRMYEMLSEMGEHVTIRVFRARSAAAAWLERDLAEVERLIEETLGEV